MKKYIGIILSAMLLASCAEAPEEVKRENEVLNNASVAESLVSVSDSGDSSGGEAAPLPEAQRKTLDEIRACLDSDIADNKTNISAKRVFVSEAAEMPVYSVKRHFGTVDVFKDITKELLGSLDESKLGHHDDGHSYFKWSETLTLHYNNECEGGWYYPNDKESFPKIWYNDCGNFVLHLDSRQPYEGDLTASYDLRKGESFPDEKLTLTDGGECSVSEAVSESEKESSDYISRLFGEGITVKVYKADVYKRETGCCITMYSDLVMANGAPVLCGARNAAYIEEFYQGKMPMITENIVLMSKYSSKAGADITLNRTLVPDEKQEEGDKLLCYGDAVNILSARLAQSSAYDFDCASLEYVLTAPYSKEYCEQAVYNDGSQFMSFYEELYLHMDNNKEYLRPCWVFRDFSKNYEGTTEWFHGGIYLVDALTGEVFIY